jgi:hypothetical protein
VLILYLELVALIDMEQEQAFLPFLITSVSWALNSKIFNEQPLSITSTDLTQKSSEWTLLEEQLKQ